MAETKYTQEQLHEMFEYRDGNLHWKIKPSISSQAKIGDKANKINTDTFGEKFDAVRIGNTAYRTGKLVYQMFHGKTPRIIRYLDGNKLNCKIENLEDGTK